MLLCILMFDCWTHLRLFASLGSREGLILRMLKHVKKSKSFLQMFFFFLKTCLLPQGKKCRSMLVSLFSFCEAVLGKVTFLSLCWKIQTAFVLFDSLSHFCHLLVTY